MSGPENTITVCFSRPPIDTNELSQNVSGVYIDIFELPELAKRRTEDFLTQMTNEYLNEVQEVSIGNEKLFSDKSVVPQPILLPDCRFPIFSQLRDLCHPDCKVTKRIVLARFTWPMAKSWPNIKLWCKECHQCQQNKLSRHTKPKTCQINDGIASFSHLHLDIVGQISAATDSPHSY